MVFIFPGLLKVRFCFVFVVDDDKSSNVNEAIKAI